MGKTRENHGQNHDLANFPALTDTSFVNASPNYPCMQTYSKIPEASSEIETNAQTHGHLELYIYIDGLAVPGGF